MEPHVLGLDCGRIFCYYSYPSLLLRLIRVSSTTQAYGCDLSYPCHCFGHVSQECTGTVGQLPHLHLLSPFDCAYWYLVCFRDRILSTDVVNHKTSAGARGSNEGRCEVPIAELFLETTVMFADVRAHVL